MLDTIWKLLTVPLLVRDLNPQDQDLSVGTCISGALINQIPACALSCIQEFVDCNYAGSTCADRTDLTFLCTQNTTVGLTVGEGAVQCIAANCPITDLTDIGVFNICDNIQGAIPETMGNLTVTISSSETTTSSAMTTTYPSSIGVPSATPVLSTIVIATSSPTSSFSTPSVASTFATTVNPVATSASVVTSPPVATPIPVQTTTSSTTSSHHQGTAGASGSQPIHTVTTGLTAAQIAGIIVAGVATSALVFGILAFVFCLRTRRKARRRSARFSTIETPDLPPGPVKDWMDAPKINPSGSSQRFYAAATAAVPYQQSRRSFWRKSIKPEDIGVAVSPHAQLQISPASVASHHSSSRLLPASSVHSALRPEPLRFGTGGGTTLRALRPASDATIAVLDEEKAAGRYTPPSFQNNMMERSSIRMKAIPPPLMLQTAQPSSKATAHNDSSKPSRLALTPIYDNGNGFSDNPKGSVAPIRGMSTQRAEQRQTVDSNATRKSATHNAQSRRNTQNLTMPTPSSTYTDDALRRSAPPPKRASFASSVTDFEDEITPEHELEKELEPSQEINNSPTVASSIADPTRPNSAASPVRNLQYPRIPRPAAMSRQADKEPIARPIRRMRPMGPITPKASKIDQLIRDEAIFIRTDTSSTTVSALPEPDAVTKAVASAITQKYPTNTPSTSVRGSPGKSNPKLRPYTTNLGRKPEPSATATQAAPSNATPRSILKTSQGNATPVMPQRSPSSKLRLTPSRSNTGNLYLTVEL